MWKLCVYSEQAEEIFDRKIRKFEEKKLQNADEMKEEKEGKPVTTSLFSMTSEYFGEILKLGRPLVWEKIATKNNDVSIFLGSCYAHLETTAE